MSNPIPWPPQVHHLARIFTIHISVLRLLDILGEMVNDLPVSVFFSLIVIRVHCHWPFLSAFHPQLPHLKTAIPSIP